MGWGRCPALPGWRGRWARLLSRPCRRDLQRSPAQEPRTEPGSPPCPAPDPPEPHLCRTDPQEPSCAHGGSKARVPARAGGTGDTLCPVRCRCHPQGIPHARTGDRGDITAACLGHPSPWEPVRCWEQGGHPFWGQRGSAGATPRAPQPAPGAGVSRSLCLGWRWLFV